MKDEERNGDGATAVPKEWECDLYIITEGLTKLLTNIFVSICQPFTRLKKKNRHTQNFFG